MPADPAISDQPSVHHGNGDAPYQCFTRGPSPPPPWAIDYGYCRHSLEPEARKYDHRCPAACMHRAPEDIAEGFHVIYMRPATQGGGAIAAAAWAREQKEKRSTDMSATNSKWSVEYMAWRVRRVEQLHQICPTRRAVLDKIAAEEIDKPWLEQPVEHSAVDLN